MSDEIKVLSALEVPLEVTLVKCQVWSQVENVKQEAKEAV
jgi:hypothetical protein